MATRHLLQTRRARFEREAARPPPPLPAQRIAWAGGNIETSDKDAALRKFVARKAKSGEALTADQTRALSALGTLSATGVNSARKLSTTTVFKPAAVVKREPPKPNLHVPIRAGRDDDIPVPSSPVGAALLARKVRSQQQRAPSSPVGAALLRRKVRNQQQRLAAAEPAAAEQASVPTQRIRSLAKKLREIEALEARCAAGGGLQDEQRAKLARKPELAAELQRLRTAP